MRELESLGHVERMKNLPTNRQEWLSFLSLPFKAFVFAYGLIYPFWLFSAPGTPGTIGGPDYSVLERLAVGYFFAFLALLGIGVAQAFTRNRRGAIWSIVFAVLALFLAGGMFHPYYR
jgi:glucan phosphoethanolaminetransferase (alkaline phosphatase superfamily)